MDRTSANRTVVAGSFPLYVVKTGTPGEDQLKQQLSETNLSRPIEHMSPDGILESIESKQPGAIVYPAPAETNPDSGGERRDVTEYSAPHENPQRVISRMTAAVDGSLDCPVIVIGAQVETAAVYEAGATDIIPLSIPEHIETVAGQIARTVATYWDGRFAEDLLDETNDGIIVHDPETGEIIACNNRFYEMLGYDPATDEISLEDFTGHRADFTKSRAVQLIRGAATGGPKTFEWEDPTNDGSSIWVEVKLDAAQLAGEKYVVASVREITARKDRERELQDNQVTLQRLHEIVADPDRTFEEQVGELLEFGTEQLGVDIGFLSRIDEEASHFEIEDARGDHPLIQRGRESHLGETYCRRVIDTNTQSPLAIQHAEEDGMADDPAYEKFDLGCYLGAEIIVNGDLYGTLCFADESPKRDPFSQAQQTLIDYMAQWLRQELEQQEYIEEIESTRRRLERMLERIDDGFFALDEDWRIRYVNDAGADVLRRAMGLSNDEAELVGRHLWDEIPEAVETAFYEQFHRAMDEQESVTFEEHYEPLDTWFEVRAYPDKAGISVYFTDVTERRRNRRISRQLLSTTRELIDAGSREEIAGIVSDAAVTILDHDINAVYLRSDENGGLSLDAVAWSEKVTELFGQPVSPTEDGPAKEALRRGEPVIVEDVTGGSNDTADRYGPVQSMMMLPLGDHGVLAVGATEPEAFGTVEQDRAQLLTTNAATGLDRMARRIELQRYETLFESVQDKLYVTDEDGFIELISEPLARAVGYEPDDLHGQHISTITDDDTATQAESLIVDLVVTPDSVSNTYEGTLVSQTGEEIPVEIELSLLPYDDNFRGAVGAVQDISERRQREEELRVFREAITEAGIGMAMYDESGRIEYANDQYAQMVGRTRDGVHSIPVWEFYVDLTRNTFDSYWDSFESGETRREEAELSRPDGSTFPAEVVTTAVEIDGVGHHLVTVEELTGRRERRQQSQVLHRIIRHNLRNDLTVILGHANHLADSVDGQAVQSAETIRETAGTLQALTDTAQDAQEIIEEDIVRKPIDVVEMLRDEIRELRSDFDVTVETELPRSQAILADTPLRVALRQLLTNAVEHNDTGSPVIEIRVESVPDRPSWIAIEIVDNGPGIPEHELAVLTAGEETSLQHGSGLGLWIVQWVVTRYGGELEFEETPEGGSLVRIRLPVADAPSGVDAAVTDADDRPNTTDSDE